MSEDLDAMYVSLPVLPEDANRRVRDIAERLRWLVNAPEGVGSTITLEQKFADIAYLEHLGWALDGLIPDQAVAT